MAPDASVVVETPRPTKVTIDPSTYKKMAKCLKSTKLDKALEGCEAAMDPLFVAKSNALPALMNISFGNKKVAAAAFPALRAVASFVDPESGRNGGHFGVAGSGGDGSTAGAGYTTNGLLLINKKSGSWKGIEKVVAVLDQPDTVGGGDGTSLSEDDLTARVDTGKWVVGWWGGEVVAMRSSRSGCWWCWVVGCRVLTRVVLLLLLPTHVGVQPSEYWAACWKASIATLPTMRQGKEAVIWKRSKTSVPA